MNENLDLTKILEGCPQGTKFYSSIYGEVSFVDIKICFAYPIMLMSYGINQLPAGQICYAKDGNYNSAYNGECTLFPSKDQRDWSKFVRFWDKLKVESLTRKPCSHLTKCLRKMGFHLNGLVHFSLIWITMYHFPFIAVADISKFASPITKKQNILLAQKKIARSSINGGRSRYGNL